jgi:predicted nucleotidyltransferase
MVKSSDIDLVVTFPPSTQVRLRRLASVLEAEEICRDSHIIENASVSICILRRTCYVY